MKLLNYTINHAFFGSGAFEMDLKEKNPDFSIQVYHFIHLREENLLKVYSGEKFIFEIHDVKFELQDSGITVAGYILADITNGFYTKVRIFFQVYG